MASQLFITGNQRNPSQNLARRRYLFLRTSLLGGLGDLAGLLNLDNGLDNTDSDSLPHVTDGETAKRGVLGESLNTHGLGRNHLDDGSITRLDELGGLLNGFTGTTIDLLDQLSELASDVGGVAVQDGGVSVSDLTGMVHQNDLSVEGLGTLRGVVLGVTSDVATTDFLDGNVLHVETNVITGETLSKLLVVHFDGLDFGGHTSGGERDDHTRLDGTRFDTTDRHCSNTTDLVDILERKTEGLAGRPLGTVDGVDSLKKGLARRLATLLGLLVPSLVPWAVARSINHVVTIEPGDGDKGNCLGVEPNLLDEVGDLLDDFLETVLRPFRGVHLIDGNDELLDTEGVGEQSVFTSLTILGNTGLELTGAGSDDENGAVGLGGTGDHVLDEVTVTGGINDGDIVLGGLELPEGDIDSNTTLTLGLQFVQDPGVLEGTLSEFGSLLLELLNGTLVNTTALVDKMTGSRRLSGIDMADDDDVDVRLLLSHCEFGVRLSFEDSGGCGRFLRRT